MNKLGKVTFLFSFDFLVLRTLIILNTQTNNVCRSSNYVETHIT